MTTSCRVIGVCLSWELRGQRSRCELPLCLPGCLNKWYSIPWAPFFSLYYPPTLEKPGEGEKKNLENYTAAPNGRQEGGSRGKCEALFPLFGGGGGSSAASLWHQLSLVQKRFLKLDLAFQTKHPSSNQALTQGLRLAPPTANTRTRRWRTCGERANNPSTAED